jgi:hypothetical protein
MMKVAPNANGIINLHILKKTRIIFDYKIFEYYITLDESKVSSLTMFSGFKWPISVCV